MSTESKVQLTGRPYAERQFLMVVDDAIAECVRLRRELEEAEAKVGGKSKDTDDWPAFAAMIVGLAFPAARVAAMGIAGYEAIKRGLQAWRQASESMDICQVAASEASALAFPPGHPKPDVLYIGHPAAPDRYCTPSDFHRMVFEHKFSEAVSLLMALGATAIEVHHVVGWTEEILGTMASTFGVAGIAGAAQEAEAHSKNREDRSLILKASFDRASRKEPYLPDNMVWYPHEQLWQTVAQGRIDHQLTRCSLAVNYADDFGVNEQLHGVIAVPKKGGAACNLGGSWKEHATTVWRIDATFGDDGAEVEALGGKAAEGADAYSAPKQA